MKKLLLFSALATLLALPTARADDSVRAAQTILQSAGFYTGAVDGELNAETKTALRRYQIRNQLEPSGTLTADGLIRQAQRPRNGFENVWLGTPKPQPR